MNLIGGCMILLGSMGLAVSYCLEERGRIRTSRELRELLELMEGEIRYGRRTLPECLVRAGAQKGTELGRCFEDIGRRALCAPQESLSELLKEGLEGKLGTVLPSEELRVLWELSAPEGYQEEEMQQKALQRSRHLIEAGLAENEARLRERTRVACCLGLMGGLFVILLLW